MRASQNKKKAKSSRFGRIDFETENAQNLSRLSAYFHTTQKNYSDSHTTYLTAKLP